MRKLLQKLILVLALFVGTSAFAQFRIATVDLGRVFTNYWKTKQAWSAIDEHRSEIEKKGKDMLATFNSSKADYQKMLDSANDPAVSSEERDKRKRAAEDKLKDLKDQDESLAEFDRGSRTSLDEQIRRTHENIISDIRVVISSRAKADGYTLVIDTAAQSPSGAPVVLYNIPGENDITDAVIKQINLGAPVDSLDSLKTDVMPAASPPAKSNSK